MATTFTPNIGLGNQARGDNVGTWDTQVDTNFTLVDSIAGNIATIGLNNANVVLSAAQFQSEEIVFNSTLTGSVTITFPTTFTKSYVIQHVCTGSSQFTITLTTTSTATGAQSIGCPPGELFECRNDGTSIKFKNFGRVGEYYDHCGSSVPSWIPACTVPPYLNCDGTTFSSATYPVLANYLGGNTLPDMRGRLRGYLNQGTGRITSSQGGVDGNTLLSSGGAQTTTLSSQNIPPVPITDHTHTVSAQQENLASIQAPSQSGFTIPTVGLQTYTTSGASGLTVGSSSPTSFTNLPPMAVGGITLIRAA